MKNSPSPILACCFFLITTIFSYQQCPAADAVVPSVKNEASSFSSVEELRILSKIQDTQANANDKGLTMREKELKTLSEVVDKKLGEINLKLEELQTLQKSLKALMAQRDAEELKRIKELGKIYEKMTPDKAAFALANMDDKLATDLLASMKVKSAAKILNVLDRKKASELSKTFSTVK
jgi:flagellar motility protein MotE (MotC chaperone)